MAVTQRVCQLRLKQSAPTVAVIIKWLSSMEVAWDPRSMGPSMKSILFCFVLFCFVQVEEHKRQNTTRG